jgi:glutamyl-tRNA synthetase
MGRSCASPSAWASTATRWGGCTGRACSIRVSVRERRSGRPRGRPPGRGRGGPKPGPRPPPHGPLPGGAYPGTCRHIDATTRRRRIESGERFALRVNAGCAQIDWHDRLLGQQHGVVDDFVVVRADGVHAYQLAVVVDDAQQGVDEVVRGADLAESTPRQILLQRLLGLAPVSYAHVPLVLSAQGTRLAKRDHAVTLAEHNQGPALTLALLAHSIGLASERDRVESPGELLSEFDPAGIPNEPWVFS